ncbi:hypothetical protein HOK51_01445 [Candidatus Woesearchaeota archaeon]|jgi:uncharacterized protein|nr:hypothetical protein [Candidatus Woesearchaeota archaeon]MBT7366990.1 hypothetical protein [Candidatus Woesearchaeota archaeon]
MTEEKTNSSNGPGSNWQFIPQLKKIPKLNNPIIIEGMPGIGNVGKIAADFIIDQIKAKKLYDVFSYDLPNSVFINEKNLIEMPVIEVYYKKYNGQSTKSKKTKPKRDVLILTGDLQPTDGKSCYEFCDAVLDLLEKHGGTDVVTLGGIGLTQAPKKPQIYCTGNNKEIVKSYQKVTKINDNIFGVVGPIIGVSGLLLGLAQRRGIPGVCLLAETLGHPAYLGVKGARELIRVLDKKLKLGIKMKNLDREITELEKELTGDLQELSNVTKGSLKKIRQRLVKETNYIG